SSIWPETINALTISLFGG
ncbi:hypothetical protein D043_0461, partial [Vibrio parahaemolyticus EKP-021]